MKRGLNSQTITVLSIILVAIFFTSFQSPTGFATKLNIPSLAVSEETKNNTQTKITTPKQKNPFKTTPMVKAPVPPAIENKIKPIPSPELLPSTTKTNKQFKTKTTPPTKSFSPNPTRSNNPFNWIVSFFGNLFGTSVPTPEITDVSITNNILTIEGNNFKSQYYLVQTQTT